VPATAPAIRVPFATPFVVFSSVDSKEPRPSITVNLTVWPSGAGPPPTTVTVALTSAGLTPSAGRLSGSIVKTTLAMPGPSTLRVTLPSTPPVVVAVKSTSWSTGSDAGTV